MNRSFREARYVLLRVLLACGLVLTGLAAGLQAATYHVAQTAAASDSSAGTETAPWKTISRAASAKELKPGDTVLIHSGVYRESVAVTVSGEPGRPITFAAAPQERVVIKGSEVVKGRWTRLGDVRQQQPDRKEPFPHAFRRVWKIRLGDEFFTDARFQGSYADKSRRWVSQVFLDDARPLQMIGPDPIYTNKELGQLTTIGQGLADMIPLSFYFDPKDQTLYLCMGGEPGWFCVEVGVRGFALTADNVHDVVIRGLEMRHNRQPGGSGLRFPSASAKRVVVEDCKVHFADFNGLSLAAARTAAAPLRPLLQRLYRHGPGTHRGLSRGRLHSVVQQLPPVRRRLVAAGMKNIPGNRRPPSAAARPPTTSRPRESGSTPTLGHPHPRQRRPRQRRLRHLLRDQPRRRDHRRQSGLRQPWAWYLRLRLAEHLGRPQHRGGERLGHRGHDPRQGRAGQEHASAQQPPHPQLRHVRYGDPRLGPDPGDVARPRLAQRDGQRLGLQCLSALWFDENQCRYIAVASRSRSK